MVAIFLVLGLIMPTDFSVKRSVSINAPKTVVFEKMNSLEKMDNWSPWSKMDPNMKSEFIGTEGTVGSIHKWNGNNKVGEGEQEIKEIIPNALIKTELRFKKPMETINEASLTIVDEGDGSIVTWEMKGKTPFPWNAMGAFMNMDEMVGKDFDKGLAELKQMAEKQ